MKPYILALILVLIQITRFLFGHKKMFLVSGPELTIKRFLGTLYFCRFYRKPRERYARYHIHHCARFNFWDKTTLYIPVDFQTIIYAEGRSLLVWDILSRPKIIQTSRFPEMPVPEMFLKDYREARIA